MGGHYNISAKLQPLGLQDSAQHNNNKNTILIWQLDLSALLSF